LIQTIGRAARNIHGRVIMYADRETEAMRTAIGETNRRRAIQQAHNEEHDIAPESIVKGVSDIAEFLGLRGGTPEPTRRAKAAELAKSGASDDELESELVGLEEDMFQAAEELQFERAAQLRDAIKEIRRELDERRGLSREPRTAPTPSRRSRGRRR
jgi:excinuclease ABC subunit B